MTNDNYLQTGVEFKAEGVSDIRAMADALSQLADRAREMGPAGNDMAKGLEQAEKSAGRLIKSTQAAAKSIRDIQSAQATQAARTQRDKIHPGLAASEHAREQAARIRAKFDEEKITAELKEQIAQRRKAVEIMRQQRTAAQQGPKLETGTNPGSARDVAGRMSMGGFAGDAAYTAKLMESQRQEALAAAKANMMWANSLSNTRYALHDVSNSLVVVGVGLTALNIGTLKAASDYESAMAQISRTSGISGQGLRDLRNDFLELAQTVPETFANLADIGTLAGQLDIPSDRIADFTKTVAQFTATTNVSVDASATAFGRLDALLDDVQGNYEALGSSILQVGINSVATESEIISTTSQITAAAQQAGFLSKEIIGLAASYASLGVAPEASRGTTIRFFSTLNRAVSEGGDNLQQFARLSNMSAQEFRESWRDSAGTTFVELIKGMNQAINSGENLENVIRGMGITAVRDINALLKLAQNSEIVADNFFYAADGFDQATALGEAFEIQAATLASKLQMLVNTFQGFFATIGESGLGPVGALVDLLKDLVVGATELAKNPFAQWLAVTVGLATAVTAGVALLGAAMSRLGASAIASTQAWTSFRYTLLSARGELAATAATVNSTSAAMNAGAAAARGLRVAMLGLGVMGALGVGVGVIGEIWTGIADKMKSAAERAGDAFGGLSDITTALRKDTEEAAAGAEVFGEVAGTITRTKVEYADWAVELQNATGAQLELGDATQVTSTTIEDQTYKIGENTKLLLANKLASMEAVQELFKLNSQLGENGAPTLDLDGILSASVANDTAKAKTLIQEFFADYKAYVAENGEVAGAAMQSNALLGEVLTIVEGALEGAANEAEVLNSVYNALGIEASVAGDELDDLANDASNLTDRLTELRSAVDMAFETENLAAQMSQDFYRLASGIIESGAAMDFFSQSGITNLNNFQKSVASAIAAGETLGMSATDSVAVLFLELQKMGIDTANLLARVAKIPGVSIAGVTNAMKSSTGAMQRFQGVLGGIGGSARKAAKSIGGSRSGGNRDSLTNSVKEAREEVRTLADYASDLRTVMSRAFEIQFSASNSADNITKGWREISKATEDARANIREIRAEMAQLTADKAINKYFLKVAEQYGDTLRAGQIRGDLAKIDSELTGKQKELKEQQDKTNKSLEGNTDAAINNRATLQGLLQEYQNQIQALASSGMGTDQLKAKTEQLRQDFIRQATQLGFNRVEVLNLASSFDAAKVAIDRVPRNITVSANPNPALQALAEFEAKAAAAASRVRDDANRKLSSIGTGGVGGNSYGDGWNHGNDYGRGWTDAVNRNRRMVVVEDKNIPGGKKYSLRDANGNQGQWFFRKGGYTGNVGVNQSAGIVHGKEFVINAENTAKFRPILEQMNKGRMPVMSGGGGGLPSVITVQLSAYDRALVAANGNVQLNIDGRSIAEATNAANFVAAQRGSN